MMLVSENRYQLIHRICQLWARSIIMMMMMMMTMSMSQSPHYLYISSSTLMSKRHCVAATRSSVDAHSTKEMILGLLRQYVPSSSAISFYKMHSKKSAQTVPPVWCNGQDSKSCRNRERDRKNWRTWQIHFLLRLSVEIWFHLGFLLGCSFIFTDILPCQQCAMLFMQLRLLNCRQTQIFVMTRTSYHLCVMTNISCLLSSLVVTMERSRALICLAVAFLVRQYMTL